MYHISSWCNFVVEISQIHHKAPNIKAMASLYGCEKKMKKVQHELAQSPLKRKILDITLFYYINFSILLRRIMPLDKHY